jgi:hypothetical protein
VHDPVNGSVPPRLATFNDDLLLGGWFVDGPLGAHWIGRWDGQQWHAMGPSGNGVNFVVNDMMTWNDRLWVAGWFSQVGNLEAPYLAAWDGASWSRTSAAPNNVVHTLGTYNSDLVIGGKFTAVGSAPARHVARWDGGTWIPLGTGTPIDVFATAEYRGDLYVAGFPRRDENDNLHVVDRWDGQQWTTLPPGLGVSVDGITSMVEYDDKLILGGSIWSINGERGSWSVASWDGTQWGKLGSGQGDFAGFISLAVHEGSLVALGDFEEIGDVRANGVARWDGERWEQVGSGLSHISGSRFNRPFELIHHEDQLVAVGWFGDSYDLSRQCGIAMWDGGDWRRLVPALNGGLGSGAYTGASFKGQIYIGGEFWEAGGINSSYIARWGRSEPDVRITEPEPEAPDAERRSVETRLRGVSSDATGVHITFALAQTSPVQLDVFDVRGRRLRSVFSASQGPGLHSVAWDRRDEAGHSVARGVYLVRFQAGSARESRKLVLVSDPD